MCWYHTASDDTSGRPSEILVKRFSDVQIKMHDGKVFGEMEIGRGGKTKSRIVPLVRSLPYYKQLAARNTDPQSYIFRSERRGFRDKNKPVSIRSLYNMYMRLKKEYFPSLLDRAEVPAEDKSTIKEMLERPYPPSRSIVLQVEIRAYFKTPSFWEPSITYHDVDDNWCYPHMK